MNNDLTALYDPDIEFTVETATTHNGLASTIHNKIDLSKITEHSIIQIGQLVFHVSQTTEGMYTKVLTSGSYISISEFILSADACNLHVINITNSTSATFSANPDGTAVSVGTVVKVWY